MNSEFFLTESKHKETIPINIMPANEANIHVKDTEETAKEIFLKWSETLTIHSIPNIFRTKHIIIKLIWIGAFLISSGLCGYLVYSSINNYLEFNVVTTIKVVRETPIIFPSITICNANPFVTESSFNTVYNIIKSKFEVDLYNILDPNITLNLLNSNYTLFERFITLNYLIKQITTMPSLKEKKIEFGFPFSKFVVACFFALEPCNENDFVQYYSMMFGTCYRFNSGKLKNGSSTNLRSTTRASTLNSLVLELFVGDASDPRSMSMSSGAQIFIHNDSLTPNMFEGLSLNVGTMTYIAVHKTYSSKLPFPYSDCTDNLNDIGSYDSEYFRMTMSTNNSYRQSDCFSLCYQIYLNKKCKCYDAIVRSVDFSLVPCINTKEAICQIETMKYFSTKSNEICADQCPAECYTTTYSFKSSTQAYPARSYAYSLLKDESMLARFENKTNVDYETLKENILAVNVYFEALESTTIDEGKQMEMVDLIAGIGGTLGLFLGISVLSLFEVVEILLEILLSKTKKQKSNKIKNILLK
jgi:hypothetical protein